MERTWAEVGKVLRWRRENLHLTQQELADRAGLSLAIVQVIEGGRKESYRRSTLVALAAALEWDQEAIGMLLAGADPDSLESGGTSVQPSGHADYHSRIMQLPEDQRRIVDDLVEMFERQQDT